MFKISNIDLGSKKFARVISELKNPFKGSIGKTSYKDLIFARGEFFRLVRAQNESLRVIIIYYMFKYTFGIITTLLESLRSQKDPSKGSI